MPTFASFAGSSTIDPVTGTISLSGTVNESAVSRSRSYSASLTTSVFVHNPFPIPGGHTVTTTITDVLEVSVSYDSLSKSVSGTSIAPSYLGGDRYRVPLSFAGNVPVSLTYTLTEDGTFISSHTLKYMQSVSLGLTVDVTNYPSSVEFSAFVDNSGPDYSSTYIVAPSGNSFLLQTVPEPSEYMVVFGTICMGTGMFLRHRRNTSKGM